MTDTLPRKLPEDDWTSLVTSVSRGLCILMLGPNAVTGVFDGETMPIRDGLARFVKRRLGEEYAHVDETDVSAVAQAATQAHDPFTLRGWVEDFYNEHPIDDPILTELAGLPFRLVVNTAPGVAVEKAFQQAKPNLQVDFYDYTGPAKQAVPDGTMDAPLTYHLYGSLQQPTSLVLSDNDRLDFLVSVISENPPLPANLTSSLADPNRPFLFLGFGLQHWQLRILVHVLAKGARRRFKSFALELGSGSLDEGARLFYQEGHKITFFDMDLGDFVTELKRRAGDVVDEGPRAAFSPDAPAVFLCHASEDSQYASTLASNLQARGIRTWIDRENLRGGDRWDDLIEHTITEEVGYVVVLQSEALKQKEEGYVNREIALARERQMHFRAPRVFLIPVVIDSAENVLSQLSDLNWVDLTRKDGLDRLVTDIERDIERARRAMT